MNYRSIIDKIRESIDPLFKFPSSWFGFGDWPIKSDLLLDDINQIVITKNLKQGFGERYSYDEYLYNQLHENKQKDSQ